MNHEILSEIIDKDRINYFNIDEEFFLFDSNNLTDIHSRLYGFSLQDSGIYENENLTCEAFTQMDGCGCYVYVDVGDKEITITQDFNGSWGIYIFQSNNYFAISNSFFRLLDHIKGKYPISLDRDYCNHIIVDPLASLAYSETPIKEIKLTPRNAIIKINLINRQLFVNYVDYKECSLSLNSEDGLAVLDHWFERWTTIFRKLKEKGGNIVVDLSGGFDSRMTFLLFLCSGINLNEIGVSSMNDHLEDYEIASSIAEYYGFKLNSYNFPEGAMHYSLQDMINISFYTKMGFHKEMYLTSSKYEEKIYHVGGAAGETIRARWNMSADEHIQRNVNRCNRYSTNLAKEMGDSVAKIMKHAYEIIGQKIHIDDLNSIEYPLNFYKESICRSHFGKAAVESWFANRYVIQPLIDPDLRKIRLSEPECCDNNLLMAMIYVRYCPKLLDFKFQGNKSISKDTIEFANKINNRSPYSPKKAMSLNEDFNVVTRDSKVSEILENNNTYITEEMVQKYFKEAFDSVNFRKLFAMYFDEEIYRFAKQSYEKTDFYPLRECYSTLAIGKVIEDILVSENIRQPLLSQNLDYFIQNNYYQPDNNIDILENLKNYITARIDIKLINDNKTDLEIVDISDAWAKLSKPLSLQKDGTCIVIESYAGKLDINLKIKTEGNLRIELKSMFVWGRDKDTDRIPYWIDYHFCKINDLIEFSDIEPAWHDQPIYINRQVTSGDKLILHLEWSPHRSDTV